MRIKSVKYGKSAKFSNGSMEHMEVFVEVRESDHEDDAIELAKHFVARHLDAAEKNTRDSYTGETKKIDKY